MPLAAAATWTRVGDMIEWQGTEVIVRPDPDGTITVYQNERVQASLAFFQWHDAWIYERLDAGALETEPTREADGSVRFLRENLDQSTSQYLAIRNDGQVIGKDF